MIILIETLVKASKEYGLNISEPAECFEMPDRSNNPEVWIRKVDECMSKNNYHNRANRIDINPA